MQVYIHQTMFWTKPPVPPSQRRGLVGEDIIVHSASKGRKSQFPSNTFLAYPDSLGLVWQDNTQTHSHTMKRRTMKGRISPKHGTNVYKSMMVACALLRRRFSRHCERNDNHKYVNNTAMESRSRTKTLGKKRHCVLCCVQTLCVSVSRVNAVSQLTWQVGVEGSVTWCVWW